VTRKQSAAVQDVTRFLWAFRKSSGWEPGKTWDPYAHNYCFPGKPVCRCHTPISYAWTTTGMRVLVENGSAGQPDGQLAVWQDTGTLRCRRLDDGEKPAAGEHRGTEHVRDRCPSAMRSATRRKKWRATHSQGKLGS
jgi:hypothetical protein